MEKLLKLLIFLFIVLIGCSTNIQKENKLLGSWYFEEAKLTSEDSAYNELFITDDYFIYFIENHFLAPKKYKISGDSLLFYYERNGMDYISDDYIPKFKIINENKFILIDHDLIIEFNRIDNFIFDLNKYGNLDEYSEFMKTFYKRRYEFYAKKGIKVDSVYVEEPLEEMEISPSSLDTNK